MTSGWSGCALCTPVNVDYKDALCNLPSHHITWEFFYENLCLYLQGISDFSLLETYPSDISGKALY